MPDLIAEILSPSNPDLDTVTKRAAYARAGVPEYWMLRLVTRDVMICWSPDQSTGDFTDEQVVASGSESVSTTLPIRVLVVSHFEDLPRQPAS